jgi:subtilisin family serine protease
MLARPSRSVSLTSLLSTVQTNACLWKSGVVCAAMLALSVAPSSKAFAVNSNSKISGTNIAYDSKGNPYVKGEFLVKVKTKVAYERLLSRASGELGSLSERKPVLTTQKAQWFKFKSPQTVEAQSNFYSLARETEGVELIEPNYIYTTRIGGRKPKPGAGGPDLLPEPPLGTPAADPDVSRMYGLSKVSAEAAWTINKGSKNILVADIDTGIDYNHPDVANNLWRNPNEIPGDGIDNDKNGYVDDIVGYDFRDNDARPFDDNSHGTHTFGTIAATGQNGVGVSGVAQVASVMSLRFLGGAQGSGTLEGAISSIEYATKMGARIMSNSWGGGGYSQALFDAVENAKNVVFVAAAGNEGSNNDNSESYPANFKIPTIISVSATDKQDRLATFSNFGLKTVHIAAPGVSILSTLPNGRYGEFSGTSMACPHVAGAAALVLSVKPNLTAQQVKKIIMDSADSVAGLDGSSISGGRLNVAKALEMAKGF